MEKKGHSIRGMTNQHGQKIGEPRSLFFQSNSFLLVICFCLIELGCVHRPIEDLIYADVAIKAAQKAKADVLAPDAYRKAENYYLRAKRDFNEGYFDSCKKHGKEARVLAEQAEYKALQKQTQVKGKLEDPSTETGAPKSYDQPASSGGY